jgi:hypothetical protein
MAFKIHSSFGPGLLQSVRALTVPLFFVTWWFFL